LKRSEGKWLKRGLAIAGLLVSLKLGQTLFAANKLLTNLSNIKYRGSIGSPARFDVILQHTNPSKSTITVTGLKIEAWYKSGGQSEIKVAVSNVDKDIVFMAGEKVSVTYPIKGDDLNLAISLLDLLIPGQASPSLKVRISGEANGFPFSVTQTKPIEA
jgi:hypothetical protein